MNPNSPNFYPVFPARLPRAAVCLAAAGLILTGCTQETPDPVATKTVTAAPKSPGAEASGDMPDAPDQDAQASSTPSADHTEKHDTDNNDASGNGSNSGSTKTATPKPAQPATPKAQALEFRVTGNCNTDGELQNWSKGFTPYGGTRNLIMQPDGTAYQGLLNGGQGHVDGMGHSQWSWLCDAKDQLGKYTGQITDLGPDNTYGTADDRVATYAFNTDKPNGQ